MRLFFYNFAPWGRNILSHKGKIDVYVARGKDKPFFQALEKKIHYFYGFKIVTVSIFFSMNCFLCGNIMKQILSFV